MHTYYVLGKNIYNVPGKWQRPEVSWALNIWFDCHFCSPSVVEVMENSSGACSFPWADPAKDKIKVTFIFFHLVPISLTLLSSLISEQRIILSHGNSFETTFCVCPTSQLSEKAHYSPGPPLFRLCDCHILLTSWLHVKPTLIKSTWKCSSAAGWVAQWVRVLAAQAWEAECKSLAPTWRAGCGHACLWPLAWGGRHSRIAGATSLAPSWVRDSQADKTDSDRAGQQTSSSGTPETMCAHVTCKLKI